MKKQTQEQSPQLTHKEQAEHIDTLNEEIKHLSELISINRDLCDDVIGERTAKRAWIVFACISLVLNIVAVIGMDKVPQ